VAQGKFINLSLGRAGKNSDNRGFAIPCVTVPWRELHRRERPPPQRTATGNKRKTRIPLSGKGLRLPPSAIESWAKQQNDKPSRSEAIRRLIEFTLAAKVKGQNTK